MPSSRYSRQDDYDDYRRSNDNYRRSGDNYRESGDGYRQSGDNYWQSDDNQDDTQPERRRSDRRGTRVKDVSYSELQSIRENELGSMERLRRNNQDNDQDMGMVRRSRTQDDQLHGNDMGSQTSRRQGRRSRYADDSEYDYRRNRNADDGGYGYRRSSRRESAPDYGGGEKSGRRSGRSERGSQANDQQVAAYQQGQQQQSQDQDQSRSRSRRNQNQQSQQNQQNQGESEDKGQDDRKDCFWERHLDRGSDGIISAAAGAALGAITARHFAGPKDFSKEANTEQGKLRKNWRMIAGAVAGAAAFNVGENLLKTKIENDERKDDMVDGMEFVQEMMAEVGPDVM